MKITHERSDLSNRVFGSKTDPNRIYIHGRNGDDMGCYEKGWIVVNLRDNTIWARKSVEEIELGPPLPRGNRIIIEVD